MTTRNDFSQGRTVGAIWAQKCVLEALLSDLNDGYDSAVKFTEHRALGMARDHIGAAIDELDTFFEIQEALGR